MRQPRERAVLLEDVPDAEVDFADGLAGAPVELEAVIETEGADGRQVPQAEARGAAKLTDADGAVLQVDSAAIHEQEPSSGSALETRSKLVQRPSDLAPGEEGVRS